MLVFAACAGGAGGGGCNGDEDDSAGDECNVLVRDPFPSEGATDMCFRSEVEFIIDGGDENAVITLADGSGADVPGTTTSNAAGTRVSFEPDAPLAPNTSYTATLTYCSGTETLSFTTDAYGEPLAGDAKALVGNIYSVDLKNDSRFHEPPGVASVLQPLLERIIWLEVLEASTTSITLRLAVAADESDTVQDMCIPTVDFENGTVDGPTFEVGPNDIEIPIGDVLVELQGVIASGTFSADGATFGCGGFTGLLDTRPVVPLMNGDSEDYVCNLIGGYGAQCITCDDGEQLCMQLVVDQAVAKPAKGIKIVPISDADVESNPDCP
jgi:hypothetical protein